MQRDQHLASGDLRRKSAPLGQGGRASCLLTNTSPRCCRLTVGIPESAEICSTWADCRRLAMGAAIGLRDDYGSAGWRAAAKRSKDGPQARRLLAVAGIYAGATRTEAAKIGGVGLQVVRDWVVKVNAQGPDGLGCGDDLRNRDSQE